MDKGVVKAVLETSNNILLEIYGDLLKPGVAQVGQAIGTIIGLGNTILMPLALKNEQSKIILESNLDKYRKKLEEIPQENIQTVIPEIGVPVLEKLMYVSDEALVELYTELLAKASNKEQCDSTHPSFVNIINNLSPKEAKLLRLINEDTKCIVEISILTESNSRSLEQLSEFILIEDLYDEHFSAYLSNLVGLGLIEISFNKSVLDTTKYEIIENEIKSTYSKMQGINGQTEAHENFRQGNLKFLRGIIRATNYGQLFLVACTDTENTVGVYNLIKKAYFGG